MTLDYEYLKKSEAKNMYGITFDLDTHILEDVYDISRSKAYSMITKDLESIGFKHLQYSVYIKPKDKDEMLFVYQVINTLKKYEWFNDAVHNIIAFKLDSWSEITKAFKEDI